MVYTDLHGNPSPMRVKWKGLLENAIYELNGKRYTGAALMNGGIVLAKPECNYDSDMMFLKRVD